MSDVHVPVEHTTTLALTEKAKLKKSLRRFDMVFFTLCAFVGLDTLGVVASNGAQGFTWLLILGGSLAFIASEAWDKTSLPNLDIGHLGTFGDYDTALEPA
jgi:hypothetical protein